MRYTEIDPSYMRAYNEKFSADTGKPNWARIRTESKIDPSIFSKYYLGITPFVYQDQVLNDKSKRITVCSSRQIGKTYVVEIKALHFAMFHPNKTVLVFSKNIKQSQKFLRNMKQMMFDGMQFVNREFESKKTPFSNDEDPAYIFPCAVDKTKPDNMTEFSLDNGAVIMSLPATDSSRGYTADLVIVDEAGFVPDEIFDQVIEPTVRFTGGTIIMLSTPKGQRGFFFRYFDPEDKRDDHEYVRYWWNWELCPNKEIREMTMRKRKDLDPLTFAQEYEAQFAIDADAFLAKKKVDNATDEDMEMLYEGDSKFEYSCGIDYGVTKSRTVVTLTHLDPESDIIWLDFQKEFQSGYDNSQLPSFLYDLELRFNITQYVVDECPQGESTTQKLENDGKNVRRFYFGKSGSSRGFTEKQVYFFRFKTALYKKIEDVDHKRIRMFKLEPLIHQMCSMQLKQTRTGYSIEKPSGGNDDRFDSFVMACVPFLDDERKEFRSYVV